MAKGRTLASCLAQANVENVRPGVVQATNENSVEALQSVINELTAEKAGYRTQRDTKKTSIMEKEISGAAVSQYISREITDPDNELNTFKPAGFKRIAANLMQKAQSLAALFTGFRASNKELSDDEKAIYNDLTLFARDFNQNLDAISKGRNRKIRYEDFVQYFKDTPVDDKTAPDKLPRHIKDTMASVAYEWLATDASDTISNDSDSMKQILQLTNDDVLTDQAGQYVSSIGSNAEMLAESLGRKTAQRLGLVVTDDTRIDAQLRMEKSLGLMILASMEHMGQIERNTVLTGSFTKKYTEANPSKEIANVGLKAIAEGRFVKEKGHFIRPARAGKEYDKYATTEFFRVIPSKTITRVARNNQTDRDRETGNAFTFWDVPEDIKQKQVLLGKDPEAIERLFSTEPTKVNYTWKKPSFAKGTRMALSGTNEKATIEQSQNLINSIQQPWQESSDIMGLFFALDESRQMDLLGAQVMTEKHSSRSASVIGVNRSILNSIDHVKDFRTAQALRRKENKELEFYIPAKFWRQGRMGQIGAINPQGDKLHRSLFAMKDWTAEFTVPSRDEKSDSDNKLNERSFYEALAFAFDIESGKVGGSDNQIKDLEAFLARDKVAAALDVLINEYMEGNELTAEMQDTIVTAVGMGKTKAHALKGLLEYARYITSPPGDTFTTDLFQEIDGIGNGPTIGTIQLIGSGSISEAVTSTLTLAGFNITNSDRNLDELLGRDESLDIYQKMGHEWALQDALMRQEDSREIADLQFQLRGTTNRKTHKLLNDQIKSLQHKLARSEAMDQLIGKFYEEKTGFVSKAVRSLSKPRTMQTVFGAGRSGQIARFAEEDVIQGSIYDELEDIAALVTQSSLEDLAENNAEAVERFDRLVGLVRELTWDSDVPFANKRSEYVDPTGRLKPQETLGLTLTNQQRQSIHRHVRSAQGEAMWRAVEEIYGPMMETRKPFNKAVQAIVARYNTILKFKVNALIAEKKAANPDLRNVTLTNGELAELQEELSGLFPQIRTPFYKAASDTGYLPLGRLPSNDKNYGEDDLSIDQSYRGGISRLKGHTKNTMYLKDPGVAPIITIIHMLDSIVANKLIGTDGLGILNNHDGFSSSILKVKQTGQISNKDFFDAMKDYYIGHEVVRMADSTQVAFAAQLEDLGITSSVLIDSYIDSRLIERKDLKSTITHDFDEALYDSLYEKGDSVSAVKEYIKQAGPEYTQEMVDAFHEQNKILTENEARITGNNKDEVMNNVTKMMQYSQQGNGFTTGQKSEGLVLGVDPDTIDLTTKDSYLDKANQVIEVVSNFLGSTFESSGVSQDISDYPDVNQINSINAVQVLDQMTAMDNVNQHSNVQDSATHISHLQRLLTSIVPKVMAPVNLYLQTNPLPDNRETMGIFEPGQDRETLDKKIFISKQRATITPNPGFLAQGLRMSSAEVYAHELTHHITYWGMNNDSKIRKEVRALYDTSRQTFIDQYGDEAYRVFLNDPNIDITDLANRFEVEAAKDRWDYIFNPKAEVTPVSADKAITGQESDRVTSNELHEFMALGLTNENFMLELKHVGITDKSLRLKNTFNEIYSKGDTLQDVVVNLFRKITSLVYQTFHQQKHSANVAQELENLAVTIGSLDSRKKSVIWKFITDVDIKITSVQKLIDITIKSKITKTAAGKLAENLEKIRESDTVAGQGLRNVIGAYNDMEYGFTHSVTTEMRGSTERMKPLHRLLHIRGIVLDQRKQAQAQATRESVNALFKREIDSAEKTAITKIGIKTDLSSLLDISSMDTIRTYVDNNKAREGRITELQRQIIRDPALQQYRDYIFKASNALGYFMVTSRGRANEVVMLNAHNIATLDNTKNAGVLTPTQITKVEDIVDQLATLHALDYTVDGERRMLSALMSENLDAIEGVLIKHKQVKALALEKSFNNNPAKTIKGYTRAVLNPQIQYEQGTALDQKRFEEMGYTMQRTPIARDPNDPVQEDIFMFKSQLGGINDMATGILSFTGNVAKGTAAYELQQQIGNTYNSAAQGAANNQIMIDATENTLNQMFSSTPVSPVAGDYQYMIPQFGDDGKITELRYVMAESTKDNILEQKSEVDEILARLDEQIIDKEQSLVINKDLMFALKEMYDNDFDNNPEAYVEISPNSPNKRYRDIYHLLTPKAKTQVKDLWGANKIMVSKDVIDIAFGGRKYSITEMFNKDPQTRNQFEKIMTEVMVFTLGFKGFSGIESRKGRAIVRAKHIENFMQSLTKLGKNNIVVRNIAVTRGNYASNMAYLKSKGVALDDILTLSREAMFSVLEYQKVKSALIGYQARREVEANRTGLTVAQRTTRLDNLDRKILELQNEISLNPSTPMIEAGLLPSIVDDVETANIGSPYLSGIEEAIETGVGYLPKPLQKVGKTLFMSSDTEGYRILNNAVKLTDYIGRYVLYQHYTSKKNRNPMNHEDAVAAVNEEFINFSLPTHRTLEYLNSIGLIWFSKYQLRVLKQIKNLVADKPFTALSTLLLTSTIGTSNIFNSIPGITKDLFQAFGDPATAFVDSVPQVLYIDIADEPFE